MTIDNNITFPLFVKDEVLVKTIIQDAEIRQIFLCIALFEELARTPNPNIANLFVFIQDYIFFYQKWIQTEKKNQNALISEMQFDREKFSEFFISLYNEGIYGKGFLEDSTKREIILDIIKQKNKRILHLSRILEEILDIYISEENEEKILLLKRI